MLGRAEAGAGHVVVVLHLDPELDARAFGERRLEVADAPLVAVLQVLDRIGAEIEFDGFDFRVLRFAHAIAQPREGDAKIIRGLEANRLHGLARDQFLAAVGIDNLHLRRAVGNHVDAIDRRVARRHAVGVEHLDGEAGQSLGGNRKFAAQLARVLRADQHRHVVAQAGEMKVRALEITRGSHRERKFAAREQREIAERALRLRQAHVSGKRLLALDRGRGRARHHGDVMRLAHAVVQPHRVIKRLLHVLQRTREFSVRVLLHRILQRALPGSFHDQFAGLRHHATRPRLDADRVAQPDARVAGQHFHARVTRHEGRGKESTLEQIAAHLAAIRERKQTQRQHCHRPRRDFFQLPRRNDFREVERGRQFLRLGNGHARERDRRARRQRAGTRELNRGDEPRTELRTRPLDAERHHIVIRLMADGPDDETPDDETSQAQRKCERDGAHRERKIQPPVAEHRRREQDDEHAHCHPRAGARRNADVLTAHARELRCEQGARGDDRRKSLVCSDGDHPRG